MKTARTTLSTRPFTWWHGHGGRKGQKKQQIGRHLGVSVLLRDDLQFIASGPDQVINLALKKTAWRDQDCLKWQARRKNAVADTAKRGASEGPAKP